MVAMLLHSVENGAKSARTEPINVVTTNQDICSMDPQTILPMYYQQKCTNRVFPKQASSLSYYSPKAHYHFDHLSNSFLSDLNIKASKLTTSRDASKQTTFKQESPFSLEQHFPLNRKFTHHNHLDISSNDLIQHIHSPIYHLTAPP
jgi:hypothetical protein